jgi:tetratricopeptide (TPR) repeat protein
VLLNKCAPSPASHFYDHFNPPRIAELASECASAYYRYGSALLDRARESADVFGPRPIGDASGSQEDDKENDQEACEAEDTMAEVDKGKGKGPAAHSEEAVPPSGDNRGGAGDDNNLDVFAGNDGAVEGDLQLAWESLETARAIWSKDPVGNASELVEVHLLLGDVAMENGAFEAALADYDAAMEASVAAKYGNSDRRVAVIHYQRCLALQFSGLPEEAMTAVKSAIAVLQACKTQLTGSQSANNVNTDVDAVLEELKAKVEELDVSIEELVSTRTAVRGAMQQLVSATASGDKPATGDADQSVPTYVKDLGVVGRGTKRINLVPTSTAALCNSADAGDAQPAAKKKRSLEDIMGGSGGSSGVGFEKNEEQDQEQSGCMNGNVDSEPSTMPAFLAVYQKTKIKEVNADKI